LPLALTQAAAFMTAGQIGVAKYRDLFNKRKLALFKNKPLDYHAPLVTTWNIGIEALAEEQPKALQLLNLCAFLTPEPIRFKLLQETRAELGDELEILLDPDDEYELTHVRIALRRYALATVDETSLTLHRMVALVTRENLAKTETDYNRYAEYAVYAMRELYPHGSDDHHEWERCEELLRHAEVTAGYADDANVALNAVGYLYNQTGLYLQGRALYSAASQNFERTVAIGERELGTDHPEVARRYNNLGVLLQDMGELDAAKTYFKRAIARPSECYTRGTDISR
jgi:tetratricopeptide (TPR) repeat protein